MKKAYALIFTAVLSAFFILNCAKNDNPAAPAATDTPVPAATNTFTNTGTATNTYTITATATETGTPTQTPTATVTYAATVYSVAAMDGFVSSDGGYNNDSDSIDIGDDTGNNVRQGYVSFTMPAITGNITKATLWIYLSWASTSVLTDIGPVKAARVSPNYANVYENTYVIYSGLSGIGTICSSTAIGWYSLDVTAAVQSDKSDGNTYAQFRLYCNGPSDGNGDYDLFQVSSGETISDKPKLVIEYTQ